MSADNKSLGRFILDGIPPAPRGVPQIEVTFDMDASGILTVTAKDKATGKTQNIKITGAVGLSDDEVKKMQEEAEKHKEEDKKKAEQIEAKNKADTMVAAAEKALKDAGDKAPKDVKEKVEEKIKVVKDILETGNKEELEAKTKELSDTLSQVGQAMYGSTSSPQGGQGQKAKGPEPVEREKDKDKQKEEKVEEGEVVE
jgi:molecular chaperone DnaK